MAVQQDDASVTFFQLQDVLPTAIEENAVVYGSQSSNIKVNKEIDHEKQSQHESQIRAALNQQTSLQFRQYALEQHPKDCIKQEDLIRQLQEQHFQQYMTQIYQQQILHQRQQYEQLQLLQRSNTGPQFMDGDEIIILADGVVKNIKQGQDCASGDCPTYNSKQPSLTPLCAQMPQIVPASLWTRRDIQDFKQQIYKESRECCIKIGSLATATVRVPTHEDGSYIFWEFATDHYDIGFGVYFEWTLAPGDKVTVHISESDDEENDEENDEEDEKQGDLESGDPKRRSNGSLYEKKAEPEIPTDELIPVYRRDSHEEIYCGSHQYPGRGVYVLKFDNSYSLWRSKWLYYKIYFTR